MWRKGKGRKRSSLCMGQKKVTDCCIDEEVERDSFQQLLFLCPHCKEMRSSPEHCGHGILFFFSLLISYLFVKDISTTGLENKSVFPPTEDLPCELDYMPQKAQEKTQKSK